MEFAVGNLDVIWQNGICRWQLGPVGFWVGNSDFLPTPNSGELRRAPRCGLILAQV
jgi:hypothetical protein